MNNKEIDNPGCLLKEFTKEFLEKYHTKQLIKILRSQSIYLSTSCYDCCEHFKHCRQTKENNIILLKEILKNRPHIPNKLESKAIRKAKKKSGK